MNARLAVFLSSTFRDDFGGNQRPIPLRTRILETAHKLPVELLAYDFRWPPAPQDEALDADTIIDRCFAGIKRCDLFVFILSGRHGTGAELLEGGTSASYLELELFAAAMLQKPILVLHYKDREPDAQLIDVLLLLRKAFHSADYCIGDERTLFDRWNEACRLLADGNRPVHARQPLPLVDGLSRRRTRHNLELDIADPCLRFLGGVLTSTQAPDPDKARRLIDQVASGVRGSGQLMPHGASLFRLWAAIRELTGDKAGPLADPAIGQLWDRALGLWAGKASWFGLHGHVWMGPLAALNTQAEIRGRQKHNREFPSDPKLREPTGARASALYSIAQRARTLERKLTHFRQVQILASKAMKLDVNAQQGALAIRGNASIAMGKLGMAWKLWDAVEDFEVALTLRQRAGASAASIGEMQVDLGLCYILTGRGRRGRILMLEGIKGLRTNESADGQSFLARGLRKLDVASRVLLEPTFSKNVRSEIAEIASNTEALDQARDLHRHEWAPLYKDMDT